MQVEWNRVNLQNKTGQTKEEGGDAVGTSFVA
jgi:hypothetical protein